MDFLTFKNLLNAGRHCADGLPPRRRLRELAKVATAVSFLFSLNAHAQFDDGGDFPPPPPPGGAATSIRADTGAAAAANGTGGAALLNSKQKEKFAKASIEDITDENFPQTVESFDFPNADIQDLAKAMSELTGKNIIVDQSVRGKVTIIAPTKITVAEAYKAFLTALAMNNLTVVPSGKFLKIKNARAAGKDNIETYSGSYFPNSDQMITRIIHLKHIMADAVKGQLQNLTSANGDLQAYAPTNSLILTDMGSNIERVMKIIAQLDVPGFDDQLAVIQVHYAKAKDLADLIDKIVNKDHQSGTTNNRSNGGFSSGVPRPVGGTSQNQKGSAFFTVIPDDRTNSLVVSGNTAGIDRVRHLLTQLDFKIRAEDMGGVHVYYVKYGVAEDIAKTLTDVTKDTAPKTTGGTTGPIGAPVISSTQGVVAPQEIFGGEVKIKPDKTTNSLVIVASKTDYEVVLNILAKLDIPRDQVYVDTIIMEMNVSDGLEYSLGYFKYADGGGGAHIGFNGSTAGDSNNLSTLLNPTGGSGAILGFASGGQVNITNTATSGATAGTTQTISSLLGFLSFLKKNTRANILSNPGILALDNQEAKIKLGDKVVIGADVTQATANSPQISKPQFEDATIELTIKPYISPSSNIIRMDVEQNVHQLSDAQGAHAYADTTASIAKRDLKTSLVITSGDTAVLGGLTKETENETVIKVPLLGDIPIIGWLFKSRSTTKNKTNLTIFLTPKIMRTPQDARELVSKTLDKRLDYIKATGGVDSFGSVADQIQRKEPKGRVGDANGMQGTRPDTSKQ